MPDQVDFYYDYASPTAYLAWTQLPAICARHNAVLNYQPILLGGVFKATGNSTPVTIEPKGKWLFDDLARYAQHYNVPYQKNPFFIVNSMTMMRGAMWAKGAGVLESYNTAMYEATWINGLDTSKKEVLAEVMRSAGLDGDAMLAAVTEDAIKKALMDATQASVARGVFGAPTMFVGDEMHFGQDRLEWIERALSS